MNVFDPHIHIKQIVIVGVGGTGAQVARTAARMVYDMQRSRMHAPRILLIDPDKVEEKNCGRQLFLSADIGAFKAETVGRRLNLALGLDAAWITEPVNADKHFDRSGSVVISCVDNHLCSVSEFLRQATRAISTILTVFAPLFSQFLHQSSANLIVFAPKEQS